MPNINATNEYGAAAVDYYSSALRRKEVELPEEHLQAEPHKRVRVKAKATIAPVSVIGLGVVIVMLILVVFGYVQLYEATSENAALASTLSDLRQENAALVNQYEGQIDLAHIEDAAINELGMQKVLAEQTVYVNLSSASDRGVVVRTERSGSVLGKAFGSIVESAKEFLEYLS